MWRGGGAATSYSYFPSFYIPLSPPSPPGLRLLCKLKTNWLQQNFFPFHSPCLEKQRFLRWALWCTALNSWKQSENSKGYLRWQQNNTRAMFGIVHISWFVGEIQKQKLQKEKCFYLLITGISDCCDTSFIKTLSWRLNGSWRWKKYESRPRKDNEAFRKDYIYITKEEK